MRQCLPSPSRTSNGVRHEPDVTVRRHALHLLIVAAWLATPIAAHGQPPSQPRRIPRVGILSTLASDPEAIASRLSTSLRPLGWGYPENLYVDVRSAAGDLSRLPRLAAQLVQLKPDVLLALWNSDVSALSHETKSIPIVMVFGVDPVGAGLVEKILRPGKNVTGVVVFAPEIAAKAFGFLREAFPASKRVGFVWNPDVTSSRYRRVAQTAADELGLTLVSVEIGKASEIDHGMEKLRAAKMDSLYVDGLALFNPEQRAQMLDLAVQRRLPALYAGGSLIDRGGLMSYNASVSDVWREVAGFVDAILKGSKPEDLPLRHATKFELAVNLKTAKVLGLKLPPQLLRAANHVIQ